MKQSIFGRVAQLAKANINDLLDRAEDPQKMLDQMVRDYSENISEAESAVAQTIGNLRMLEEEHTRNVADANEWGRKALAASRKADEFRAAGNTGDAQKFDNLAKVALQRQMNAEKLAADAAPGLAAQNEVVDKLKGGLDSMKGKLTELTSKRNELVARSRTAAAQSQVHEALKGLDVADPTSALGRFEERIRREEATVRGQQELASNSLEAQFASLEDLGEQTEVEARLAALKNAGAPKQIESSIDWLPADR
ncbi:phage shock protein A, PspA (plasmid) [Pseudarthrobacter chlorophenolicus A6]|uniref:Phage shock protein A, PspA n=1 Tax=Pseudarthrobacter chlorophenolicus (strain ATCC 700700 / DSM 12829 / CIP 107037 / JCM 12360 / KCTC 9906 / NCIMB 13794 / A6) TaxID=452863 RepID=B8HHX6_PSECP|nr:PspA/IM30 family protein [Pseudarthrobacter chlorophenolicus]ACL42023.1 phage shock protein A, PspA [Pseudarthrobacter chlorophenolicus A6]SDQ20460.1 phage shock protein A (PspA) family protein [Pseudarthrobacter chlorophenolicus]